MNPDALEVAKWLAVFFFLVGGVNQLLKLKRSLFPASQPPPGELNLRVEALEKRVTINSEAVSKEEFAAHQREDTRMFEQMRAEGSKRGKDLFDRIEGTEHELGKEITCVKESVAGLGAESRLMNQQIVQIHGKIDRLIERKH